MGRKNSRPFAGPQDHPSSGGVLLRPRAISKNDMKKASITNQTNSNQAAMRSSEYETP